MDRKNIDLLKSEKKIPEEVMKKLEQNREKILNYKIVPEVSHVKYKKTIVVIMVATVVLFINPQINLAIKNILGISKDPGIAAVENSGIKNDLNLVSESNGMKLTITKFVATKRKMAFDYQFKIKDKELKVLLEKNSQTNNSTAKASDFIDIELFIAGSSENIYGGVGGTLTSRVEGDMFYGSVISTFDSDSIPENAKLILHITQLAWQDKEEFLEKMSKASASEKPFTVENAIEYKGDWVFNIDYKPLIQTATPQINNVKKLSNITTQSDALQTVAKFNAPIRTKTRPAVTIYKDGIRNDYLISTEMFNSETGDVELTFNVSALDKENAVYKLQLNEIDAFGKPIKEIGSFEIQQK